MTTKDKKLLISFLGIALFCLSFMLVYRPFNDKIEVLQQENTKKREELERLKGLEEKEEFFVTETESMKRQSEQWIAQFPSKVLEEDRVLIMKSLEEEADIVVNTISLATRQFIYSPVGTTQVNEEEESKTLAERNGEALKEQVDKVDSEIEGESSSSEEGEVAQEYTGSGRALYRNQDQIQFTAGYEGIKDMVRFFADQTKRMTIDTINLTYDKSTGILSGDASINMYSMQSDDATYEPRDTGDISLGTDDLFGTIKSNNKKSTKTTTKNTTTNKTTKKTTNTKE